MSPIPLGKALKMKIVRAREESLQEINNVIAASKGYWNYPPAYLQAALKVLYIDQNYLAGQLCFQIEIDMSLVAFFAITEKDGEKYLGHLWIDPNHLRKGLGRAALEYVEDLARKAGMAFAPHPTRSAGSGILSEAWIS
jgi:GNAT superfamily N-acetyltransferase